MYYKEYGVKKNISFFLLVVAESIIPGAHIRATKGKPKMAATAAAAAAAASTDSDKNPVVFFDVTLGGEFLISLFLCVFFSLAQKTGHVLLNALSLALHP